ncbi:YihA family ribosome biogenesis GTP-binding protein [Acetobacter tropicalis]|uniref:Probable GTP-binding protein EngB n=2 Tax=Acetobacter tropicalis TaxID=104102 RepID=F7VGE6_9PROT|nr:MULTISPECIES: ribosome biogenesis GTP-binding protein YihA/YsxC [Acetobacter]KAA8390003.1 YihA family ribosome biogenesis GTP-binding protein [Acetobacter tropicalis]KAA8392087.1 YihA family ribosome biogenesis GTP-binding protein [Acetobacter tropicalis]KGB25527.1 GTP-binding protein EngB [Acetobacter tropicalis]MBC9008117.1 YihA family ribosome biogenesis GTP-binding protein [Acetobacter tropicalis]MCC6105145.1 ribosome biogenesis GTP-binding protein YihA/YsxC [Acetobacter sp.]
MADTTRSFRELDSQAQIDAALEEGRLLFAGSCDFIFGAQKLGQLPPQTLPEIAFAGRSNVGKSSLVNALTGRKTLARASSEPGRTKQLNFFNLADRLMLVDMPGYGYAKAAKSVKEDWQEMMFDYLRGRPGLKRVMLLLDARIELKPHDEEVMKLLDRAAVSFQIVLTKCDAVKPAPLARKEEAILAVARRHAAACPFLSLSSSETGQGIEQLRAELAEFALPSQSF